MWLLRGTLGPLEPLVPFQGSTSSADRENENMTAKKQATVTKKSSISSIASVEKGWNAVFFDEEDNEVWFEPIACLALCKKGTETFVGSMVSQDSKGLVIAEESDNFLGIAPPGESVEAWEEALLNAEDDDESEEDKEEEPEVEVVQPKRRRKIIKS